MTAKVTVRISDNARRGWDRTCERYGVTLTAFIEAIGSELFDHGTVTDEGLSKLIALARRIDQERRSRRLEH